MPYTKLCSSKGLCGQITTFGLFFCLTIKKNKVCGLFHVLQTFYKLYQLKYIWVGLFFFVAEIQLLPILGYTEKVRDLAKWDPHQVNF